MNESSKILHLAALAFIWRSASSSNKFLPDNSENLFLTPLLNLIQGPILGQPLVIFDDTSSKDKIPGLSEFLIQAQSLTSVTVITQTYIIKDNIEGPQTMEFEVHNSTAIIFSASSSSDWLEVFEESWGFQTVIVMTDTKQTAENAVPNFIVERAVDLLFLEQKKDYQNNEYIAFYTFDPFAGEEGERILLGDLITIDFSTRNSVFPDRFRNFEGATIHIASDKDDAPLIMEEDDGSTIGMNVEIVDLFSKWLNFNYTTTLFANDTNWGAFVDGTYNGLLGDVLRKDKNFTMNYLTITERRLKYFDVSVPYFWEGYGFALKNPPPVPAWRNLLFPFSLQVSLRRL